MLAVVRWHSVFSYVVIGDQITTSTSIPLLAPLPLFTSFTIQASITLLLDAAAFAGELMPR